MNKERNIKKIILIVCLCILLIPLAFYIFIHLLFLWSLDSVDRYTIKTQNGDKFKAVAEQHDLHHMNCTVSSTNSDMELYFTNKIEDEDFESLEHTDDLTVYNIWGHVIFDDGSGFEEFDDSNIDKKPEVAEIVKGKLLSDYINFKVNIRCFLKSSKYQKETEQMIQKIRQEKYDELEEYGLTEDVINDGTTIKCLEYEMSHPRYDR